MATPTLGDGFTINTATCSNCAQIAGGCHCWAHKHKRKGDDMTDTDRRRILNNVTDFILGGPSPTVNADPDDDQDDDDDGDGYPAGADDQDDDQDAAPAISHAARRASRSAVKTSRETGHGRATARGVKALRSISSGDHAAAVDHHDAAAKAHEKASIDAMTAGDDRESDRHHKAATRHRAAADMIRSALTTNEVLTMNAKDADDVHCMTAAQQEHDRCILHSALTGNAFADGSFADVGPDGAVTAGDQRGMTWERPERRQMSPMELLDEMEMREQFDGRSLTGPESTAVGYTEGDDDDGDGRMRIPGGRAISSTEMIRRAGLGDLADSRYDEADDDEFGEDEDRDDSVYSDERARSTDVGSRSFTGNAEDADDVACMTAGLDSHEQIVANARRDAYLRRRRFEKRKAVRNRGGHEQTRTRNAYADLGGNLSAWHDAAN